MPIVVMSKTSRSKTPPSTTTTTATRRLTIKHAEKLLESMAHVERMRAEFAIAIADGRVDQDALDLIKSVYIERYGCVKAKTAGG
jgi:hypothetical protein